MRIMVSWHKVDPLPLLSVCELSCLGNNGGHRSHEARISSPWRGGGLSSTSHNSPSILFGISIHHLFNQCGKLTPLTAPPWRRQFDLWCQSLCGSLPPSPPCRPFAVELQQSTSTLAPHSVHFIHFLFVSHQWASELVSSPVSLVVTKELRRKYFWIIFKKNGHWSRLMRDVDLISLKMNGLSPWGFGKIWTLHVLNLFS